MRRLLLAGLVGLPLLSVIPARAQPAPPYPPIPPPRAEVLPPIPRERMVWQPGHWQWDGREYAWVGGRWIEHPVPGLQWAPGHWAWRPAVGWVWIEGHWR